MDVQLQHASDEDVTLKDIARVCGVSTATVSMALRNTGTIGARTRDRVRRMAAQMKYKPKPLIASLASRRFRRGRSHGLTSVVILSHRLKDYRTTPDIEEPLRKRAGELGYQIEAIELKDHEDTQRLGRQLHHRGVSGIILSHLYGLEALPDLPWEYFSVVSAVRQTFPLPFPVLRYDKFGDILRVWKTLKARGYRRIGWAILRHEPKHPDDLTRQAAALYCVEHTRPRDRMPILRQPIHPGDRLRKELLSWADRHRPEVVVGFHEGLCRVLEDHGYKVPGQIGYAALHTSATSRVSGMVGHTGPERIRALELLDQQIRYRILGLHENPMQVLIPATWSEGETLRVSPEGNGGETDIGGLLPGVL